jgi:hypothetical protein
MLNITKNAANLGGSAARSDAEKAAKAEAQIATFKGGAEDIKGGASPDALATGFVDGFIAGAKKAGKAVNPDTLKSRKTNYKTFGEAMAKTYGNRAGYDMLDGMIAFTVKPNATTPAKVPGSVRDAIFRGTAWLVTQNGPVADDDLVAAMKKPGPSLAALLETAGKAVGEYYLALVAADEEESLPTKTLEGMKAFGLWAEQKPHTERKAGKGVNWSSI